MKGIFAHSGITDPRRSLLELVHAMEASWNTSSTSSSSTVTSYPSSIFKGASQMETPETTATFVYTPCATFGGRWRLSWSSKFFSGAGSQRQHFLDTCFLCKKPITGEDIFMYRGDAPFCSEECRQDQMDMDEALEDDLILSRSSTAINHVSSSVKRKPTLIFAPKDQLGAGRAVAAG